MAGLMGIVTGLCMPGWQTRVPHGSLSATEPPARSGRGTHTRRHRLSCDAQSGTGPLALKLKLGQRGCGMPLRRSVIGLQWCGPCVPPGGLQRPQYFPLGRRILLSRRVGGSEVLLLSTRCCHIERGQPCMRGVWWLQAHSGSDARSMRERWCSWPCAYEPWSGAGDIQPSSASMRERCQREQRST